MTGEGAAGADRRLEAWQRGFGRAAAAVPYALLLVSTVLALVEPGRSAADRIGTLALAALAAAWMLWLLTLHPAWAARRGLMGVYCAGLIALIALLLLRSPWFSFFAFTGYLHAWALLAGRWRLVGVAVTALVSSTWVLDAFPGVTAGAVGAWLGVAAVIVALVVLFSRHGDVTAEQSRQRKEMIADLAEANRRLEAALEENAGLHAQLMAQAREAGALDERQRMAREIHDTIAQGLAGIITQIQAAEQAGDRGEDRRRHLGNATRLARESLDEARRSVRAIRPEPLEAARLPDAVAEVVRRWSSLHGVAAELATTGDARPMHPEVEVALLRTAQEALANVAKHARATRVGLTLSYMEDLVTLDVRDDGVGFDPNAVAAARPDGGYGLAAMRQRVRRLAGKLEIESEPGGGTAVWAGLPAIPQEEPDA